METRKKREVLPPAVTATKTKRRVLNIDLTAWELGEWPKDFLNSVSIEKNFSSIEVSIGEDLFQPLIRKIIQEAIETYIEDASFLFTEEGLRIQDTGDYETECIVPWDGFGLKNEATVSKIQEWIKERISDYGWDDEPEENK